MSGRAGGGLFVELVGVVTAGLGRDDLVGDALGPQDRLVGDLAMDSIELFALDEMVAARWGVRMPAQLDWTVATLGDVCHYVTVGLDQRQP